MMVQKIRNKLSALFWGHFDYVYQYYIRYKAVQIRKKEKIRVLFVLSELGAWKTEDLYLAMKADSRFLPILGVTNNPIVEKTEVPLIDYLQMKGYDYVDLNDDKNDISAIKPDISFYYKPYDVWFPRRHVFKRHLSTLPCFINYAFTTMGNRIYLSFEICNYSWLVFVENSIVAKRKEEVIGKRRSRNVRVTGIPMQDALCLPKDQYTNPWKHNDGRKKIIYAPHHTLKGTNGAGTEYATFLEFGEFMLEMAKKYHDKAVFAFKPPPTLYSKLLPVWGKEKTDDYYAAWTKLKNCQFENGDYIGLFMHSDAMIHDCGSFQVEYLFTKNPVLFLDDANYSADDQNEFGRMANMMHYRARKESEIEQFIQNVIVGSDEMRAQRENFYKDYLLPPNGQTACENIISAILGEE